MERIQRLAIAGVRLVSVHGLVVLSPYEGAYVSSNLSDETKTTPL